MNAMTIIQTKILELWRQELTTPQIGARLGMEEYTVAYQIKQLRAHGVAMPSRIKAARSESWTPERVEKLKAMHADGASAATISRALGGGLTRNAVIGKIHRMGLQRPSEADHRPRRPRLPRASVTLPGNGQKVRQRRAPNPLGRRRAHKPLLVVDMPPSEVFKPLPGVTPVRLAEAGNHNCRWPIDGPGRGIDQLYCGAEVPIGTTWCPTHTAIGWSGRRAGRRGAVNSGDR